ncbi:MAG: MATE family efflux transporter [Bacteroidaceae bacterium]|nr:MATE family efflux transporter [Bacteroidaceae bacterium]
MSRILRLALPAIISNVTVPLLGLVDMAIVGHMGDIAYIGAISIGAMIFNSVYWMFGFLRMGTSGITAQELGKKGDTERIFRQTAVTALLLSAGIILLCWPICELAMWLMSPEESVAPLVRTYYYICIAGAPAVLLQFSLTGWFIGMQDTKRPMVISISQNIFNIAMSLLLVYGLGLKVEGVALGTMLSQWFAVVLGLTLRPHPNLPHKGGLKDISPAKIEPLFREGELKRFFTINRDIFLRTLCLLSVMFFFTSAGSRHGTDLLAVNTLLMQTWLIFSYFMDGFAYAGEALCGKYHGAGNRQMLLQTVRHLFAWGIALAIVFTLLYAFFTEDFLSLLTDEREIVALAHEYRFWMIILPLIGFSAFLWDGIFIGMTNSRGMLTSCATAALVFVLVYNLCPGIVTLWNDGLWTAFALFLFTRGALQLLIFYSFASKSRRVKAKS